MNVATTRAILLNGYKGPDAAGEVVRSFGAFVVGGNYVVGLIIFAILVLINFKVITEGATRIAEVSARFSLDGMAAKRMAIDADLNAQAITQEEAATKRADLDQSTDFYMAMDGASKFVKGDAIVGLIMTCINIIGGLVIGVIQGGMDIVDAAHVFTLLTVGDGLVSQIPALIVSASTGLLVSRSDKNKTIFKQIGEQLFSNPKVMFIVSVVLLIFATIPGMPRVPFFIISFVLGGLGYLMYRRNAHPENYIDEDALKAEEEAKKAKDKPKSESEDVYGLLAMSPLELVLGLNLVPLAQKGEGSGIIQNMKTMRRSMATEMGFVVPPIKVRDNQQLEQNTYQFLLNGVKVAQATAYADKLLVLNPSGGAIEGVEGFETLEPAFSFPAKWIDDVEQQRDAASTKGYTIVKPESVIVTHIQELIRRNSAELVGRTETMALLENDKALGKEHPFYKDPGLGVLNKVLHGLLAERMSVINLRTIVETIMSFPPDRSVPFLIEKVRRALRRQIVANLSDTMGVLHIFSLPSAIEEAMVQRLAQNPEDGEVSINLDPNTIATIVEAIATKSHIIRERGLPSILAVLRAPLRAPLRKMIEQAAKRIKGLDVSVVAFDEIEDANIEDLGEVDLMVSQQKAAAPAKNGQQATAYPQNGRPQGQQPRPAQPQPVQTAGQVRPAAPQSGGGMPINPLNPNPATT
ncbi:flagellar biosynthesis protein FlhA [Deferribacterales bacterium]|nr:flagellar biosynthesis protein FlhA [Deferribacterales bacterium]